MRILLRFQIIYFTITNINQVSKLAHADKLKNEINWISHPNLMICYMMLRKTLVHIRNLWTSRSEKTYIVNFLIVQIMWERMSCISILWTANHEGHDPSFKTQILFLMLLGKRQTSVHLSGQVSMFQGGLDRKERSNTECRLLTMGLKMCELRCWGCGAADEGCWWLAAPVGGVAGFCWRSSLGGGGSGRDGGWGSGTTKCKVADKMFHNNNISLHIYHLQPHTS
jgi:hypothetical protein